MLCNFNDDTEHTALASNERHSHVPVVIVIHGHESLSRDQPLITFAIIHMQGVEYTILDEH